MGGSVVMAGGLVGLVGLVPGLVRNEDVKINEASAGSDAG